MPFATSCFTITSARSAESALFLSAEPDESVWPETRNLKFWTPAPLSFFFASMSAFASFCAFASQPFSSSAVPLLKEHWFLRPSSRSRLLTSF